MIPRLTNDAHWGFVSGRISVLENRFMNKDFFLSLISQEHISDLIPYLQETFLKDYLTPVMAWVDSGDLTDECFSNTALSLRSECPSSLPVDMFLIQGDYLNLKNALMGRTEYPFAGVTLSQEHLLSIAGGDLSELPQAMREAEFNWETGIQPETIDIILDGAYLRHLLSMAQEINSELISKYVRFRVISYIITVLWRTLKKNQPLKKCLQYILPLSDFSSIANELAAAGNPEVWISLVDGDVGDLILDAFSMPKDEQVPGFELGVQNHLIKLAKDGKLQTAGPERVFAFLAGLQAEMQNLKLTINGRVNRIDQKVLRSRLRECYV
jgi:vacuolar-type H+-ATPase subunit C/Vma6